MNLLICLVTFNRLDYTQRTIQSLLETIEVPYYLVAVDNNSSDGTQQWLKECGLFDEVILNPDNYYPGKATNIGWTQGLLSYPQATHLMRLDNDMHFEKGWDTNVKRYFDAIPELGQLGLDHDAISADENNVGGSIFTLNGVTVDGWPGCVGGPNIIRREVWEKGARYDETPWYSDGTGRTMQEDSKFSRFIRNKLDYFIGHPIERLSYTFANQSNWEDYPDYYLKTMTERGYQNVYKEKLDELKKQSADVTTEQE